MSQFPTAHTEEFYSKIFSCGKSYTTRGYLESLPCPFYTKDVTDEQMQKIIDEAESEAEARIAEDMTEGYAGDIRFRQLENTLIRYGVPYYEDI